jgi:hypothetical protein
VAFFTGLRCGIDFKGESSMNHFVNHRQMVAIGAALALALACFAQSNGRSKDPKVPPSEYKATVEGVVRDVACPIQNHKATATNFNLDCALACAKAGSPLIILTQNGDIYFPISDQMPDPSQREKLMPFVGKYVRATGTVYTRNGTRTIAIREMTELKNVPMNTSAGGD